MVWVLGYSAWVHGLGMDLSVPYTSDRHRVRCSTVHNADARRLHGGCQTPEPWSGVEWSGDGDQFTTGVVSEAGGETEQKQQLELELELRQRYSLCSTRARAREDVVQSPKFLSRRRTSGVDEFGCCCPSAFKVTWIILISEQLLA
jgi:hypothetical protein